MQHLTIYSEDLGSARLRYTLEVLFGCLLGCSFELTADQQAYLAVAGARLNYSKRRLCDDELFIPAGPLLWERGIYPRATPLAVLPVQGLPAFFHLPAPEADLPFDLPAMIFFLISRYEECLPFEPDTHGRFPASASLAWRHGFLACPLVDEWAGRLAQMVHDRFPDWSPRRPAYRFQPTYDVDLAWAYRFRAPWRTVLALIRDLARQGRPAGRRRLEVLCGRREDPYAAAFRWLADLHERLPADPVFFFLLADWGRFDRGINYRRRPLQALIRDLSARYQTGIHPSYQASQNNQLLSHEIRRLAAITEQPVSRSRQHFLRLNFPGTYQALINEGIRADYTMGYADAIGFRAGIATPYPWYDLTRERKTTLMVWPFQVMDVALKNYLKLTPQEALDAVRPLIERTRQAGGIFTTLWHNSSLAEDAEWEGWREVYRQIYTAAFQKEEAL